VVCDVSSLAGPALVDSGQPASETTRMAESPGGPESSIFRLEPGPIPLHHQVYLRLRAALNAGEWLPGDRLPGERELAQRFDCSVITVRQALGELERERRLRRMRGRGTFVTEPPIERDLTELTSFTEEMNRRGLDPQTKLIVAESREADEAAVRALQLRPGALVIFLERLRCIGDQPLLLEQVHLPESRFGDLLNADMVEGSLYQALASQYNVRLVRARETIEPILPAAREARLLQQDRRRPALLLELIAFEAAGTPVEYCRAIIRGDRAKYYVEARGLRYGFLEAQPQ
jgi:GntR family transcriptional regulator